MGKKVKLFSHLLPGSWNVGLSLIWDVAALKVLLLGKSGSGKTSMRSLIFSNYVPSDTVPIGPTSKWWLTERLSDGCHHIPSLSFFTLIVDIEQTYISKLWFLHTLAGLRGLTWMFGHFVKGSLATCASTSGIAVARTLSWRAISCPNETASSKMSPL